MRRTVQRERPIKSVDRSGRSRIRRAQLWRVLLLLACAWGATGCGVKLAYNNLDRLLRWSIDDYLNLDAAQEAYFRSQVDVFLYWHRTTELPVYAQGLRELDVALADGATIEEMFFVREEVDAWWRRILEASLPLSTQLMYSATDAQLDRFSAQFEKDTLKYIKPYEKLSVDARRERWARELRENFENFTGRLGDEQRQLIDRRSARWVPDDRGWADYRLRYRDALLALVRQRDPYIEFSRAFRDLTLNRERWYGDGYAAAQAANEDVYRDLSIEIINSLTADQRRELSKTLLDVAKDFDELTRDASPTAPPGACLVAC